MRSIIIVFHNYLELSSISKCFIMIALASRGYGVSYSHQEGGAPLSVLMPAIYSIYFEIINL